MSKIAGIDLTPFMSSVAAKLAHMDDVEQANFFNVFAKELRAYCGTDYDADMQAVFVKNKANDEFKSFCGIVSYEDES